MSDIITFGKYKGKTLSELLSIDLSYANWILDKNIKCMPEDQLKKLKEMLHSDGYNISSDSLLSSAYYNTSLYAKLKHTLQSKLSETKTEDDDDDIDYDDYMENILCSIVEFDDEYYYDPINTFIYKTIDDLDDGFIELRKLKIKQSHEDTTNKKRPSRCITQYWRYIRELVDFSNRPSESHEDMSGFMSGDTPNNKMGKWLVFLNKIKEDEEGYTELDRCWNLIAENHNYLFTYGKVKFTAKVSTRRPNPNSRNKVDGVIILYCTEKYKTKMIERFLSIYKYDKQIYWKLDCNNNYAKDNVKASDDVFYPI